jgi:hypothetical protein
MDSPESTADFVVLMPTEVDKVIKVPRGKTFNPPFMPNTTFLVIDADAKGATIENVATKQQITVPVLDPNEWNEVPVNPKETTPAR